MNSCALHIGKEEVSVKQMYDKFETSYIVHIAAEAAPFSKRGGLGDVVGSLPIYLSKEIKMDNLVFIPFYLNMEGNFKLEFSGQFDFNNANYSYKVLSTVNCGVKYCFIKVEDAYAFDNVYIDGNKPYQTDVGLHYFVFGKCIVYYLKEAGLNVHSIITHDWHSAGMYPYLRLLEEKQSSKINTIHVIHNYHHQGELFYDICEYLEDELATIIMKQYDKFGWCNMSSIAVLDAKHVVTVSPSYAAELKKKIAPHTGLQVLEHRSNDVIGILNGIDEDCWNPQIDKYITKSYSHQTIEDKYANKKFLLEKYNLKSGINSPLIVYISRLTPQKGVDLLVNLKTGTAFDIYERMERLLNKGIGFIVCGVPAGGLNGSIDYQFSMLQKKHETKFGYINYYTEEIAHQLFAGSDMFLLPSRYEPCGLTQMYAMRYGSVPIVTQVGGLKDTVFDVELDHKQGNGYHLKEYSFDALEEAIERAVKHYGDKKKWRKLILQGMKEDHSWKKRIKPYINLINL